MRRDEAGSDGEDPVEALDGAQSDRRGSVGKVFSASGRHIDIGQCKGADDFAQESHFLLLGFKESGLEVGRGEVNGESGEAWTGADVEEVKACRVGIQVMRRFGRRYGALLLRGRVPALKRQVIFGGPCGTGCRVR